MCTCIRIFVLVTSCRTLACKSSTIQKLVTCRRPGTLNPRTRDLSWITTPWLLKDINDRLCLGLFTDCTSVLALGIISMTVLPKRSTYWRKTNTHHLSTNLSSDKLLNQSGEKPRTRTSPWTHLRLRERNLLKRSCFVSSIGVNVPRISPVPSTSVKLHALWSWLWGSSRPCFPH